MDIKKCKLEQIRLAKKVVKKDDFDKLNSIAGVDVANSQEKIVACVVFEDEKKYSETKPTMNYIPGLLSYREAAVIIEAFSKLEKKPDLLIVRGHGISHPRKLGIASHIGLLLDIPTIGVRQNTNK